MSSSALEENYKKMQLSNSSSAQTPQPVLHKSFNQTNAVGNTVTGVLVIILPICLVLGAFLGRRSYRTHRAKVLRRQVESLEKMWQISPNKQS